MNDSRGFTLVETVLVMAITGLMLVTIWAGQRQLRDRARFDTSVDQMVQDINYVRSYARTGVNLTGAGNNTGVVLAGAMFEVDDANLPQYQLGEMSTLYDVPTAAGDFDETTLNDWPTGEPASTCPTSQHPRDPNECVETFFNVGDTDLEVTNANHVGIYFVNTGGGALEICRDVGTVWNSIPTACTVTGGQPITIDLLDTQSGYTSTIQVDAESGLATRVN